VRRAGRSYTQQQLTPRLAEGLVVTQGFIGSEAKGRTTTLGRALAPKVAISAASSKAMTSMRFAAGATRGSVV
jgi:hypothetical protein